jgi:hypothetical protein
VVIRYRGATPLVVVLEVQRATAAEKLYSWPAYTTLLRARFRCEVRLVVFAPDPAVARWARRPIQLGNSAVFVPTVITLDDIPPVTDPGLARAEPELAVLSALAHGPGKDAEQAVAVATTAFAAIAELPTERSVLYFDLVRAALSEAARKVIDAMIEGYEYKSDFARKYLAEGEARGEARGRAEGEARGRAEGEAKALLAVLEARGFRVTEEQRTRITACPDMATLERWLKKAVTASNANDIFD